MTSEGALAATELVLIDAAEPRVPWETGLATGDVLIEVSATAVVKVEGRKAPVGSATGGTGGVPVTVSEAALLSLEGGMDVMSGSHRGLELNRGGFRVTLYRRMLLESTTRTCRA